MIQVLKKSFLQGFFLFASIFAKGQETWPSPEVAQMYRHAQEYISLGNLKDAIITYKQAIILAPGNPALYKELARALYLSGNFNEAEATLKSLEATHKADAQCYQLLAASQAAQKEMKAAKTTLKKGITFFPASGLLYHETGSLYELEADDEDALGAWIDGIRAEPGYAPNYSDAARIYMSTNEVMWGLMYGEMYLNMAHDTAGDESLKAMLFKSYKTLFDNMATGSAPQYGKEKKEKTDTAFSMAVMQLFTLLTPVVSDGITTENLTMVRTRFLMDWFENYNSRYPFSLFSYWDELVKSGHFDIYNEWLFGKAESIREYDAWNRFHEGDLSRFISWRSSHSYHPVTTDFYNNQHLHTLFKHTKK